jgi:hypothetical protein
MRIFVILMVSAMPLLAAGPSPLVARTAVVERKPDASGAKEKAVTDALAAKSFAKAAAAFAEWTNTTHLPRSGADAFQKLAALAKTADDRRILADLAFEAIDNYWDRYEQIRYGAIMTTIMGVNGLDPATLARLSFLKDLLDKQSNQPDWQAARRGLEHPSDAEALKALALNLCFGQGNWERGLAFAKQMPAAADKDLHRLALKEFDAIKSFEVADAWMTYAKTLDEKDPRQAAARSRARMLYSRQIMEQELKVPDRGAVDVTPFERCQQHSRFLITRDPDKRDEKGSMSTPGVNQWILSELKKDQVHVWDTDVTGLIKGEKPREDIKTKWFGRIIAPMSGRYVLILDGDSTEATLKMTMEETGKPTTSTVGREQTMFTFNKAVPNPPAVIPNRATVVLEANSPAPFEMHYVIQGKGSNRAALKWIRPGSTTPETIPAEYMYKGPMPR